MMYEVLMYHTFPDHTTAAAAAACIIDKQLACKLVWLCAITS